MAGREDRQRVHFEAFLDPTQADAVTELLEAFGARPAAPSIAEPRGKLTTELIDECAEVFFDAGANLAAAKWPSEDIARWADVGEDERLIATESMGALLTHLGWRV